MTELILIASVALLASLLTFFSGFGLGTILTPFFIIFLPLESAILATAIVHFLNNVFKTFLIGAHLNWRYFLFFGLAALFGAVLGAKTLHYLSELEIVLPFAPSLSAIKFFVGLLIVLFAILEFIPKFSFNGKSRMYLIGGGLISGFFGGLSGHQGALRSAFLAKAALTKEAFIATGISIALCVDLARIPVYVSSVGIDNLQSAGHMILTAVIFAFAGAMIGKRFLKKLTMKSIQMLVGLFMIVMGLLTMLNLI